MSPLSLIVLLVNRCSLDQQKLVMASFWRFMQVRLFLLRLVTALESFCNCRCCPQVMERHSVSSYAP